MIVEDQAEVVAFLSTPEAYGPGPGPVERIETHISLVFLVGERAFKLKRAVRFPYLDFATADRRHGFCEAEVRINRRTAPDLYRGVVPVCRTADGGLRLGSGGRPVDWLVEMARFDQDNLLDHLVDAGRLDRFAVETLADVVAGFHQMARPVPAVGGSGAIAYVVDNNRRSFAETPPGILETERIAAVIAGSAARLDQVAHLLNERGRSGFLRHGHGDLHLGNIVVHGGQPLLFDAIEFNDVLAHVDVLYDLAFLVMDLESRGLPMLASILLNRYLDNTGDDGGLAAMGLFLSLRAQIRSHVDAARAGVAPAGPDAERWAEAARHYLCLAARCLEPAVPRLIALGGLSGSGKSRLARALAPAMGAPPGARIVRTDVLRKRLSGVPLGTRLPAVQYGPEMTRRTYDALFREAARALRAGSVVIADAVFAQPDERQAIARVAEAAGVPFHGLWLEAPARLLEERVSRRRHNVSDATPAVVRMQLGYDLGAIDWVKMDTSGSAEETLALALDRLQSEITHEI